MKSNSIIISIRTEYFTTERVNSFEINNFCRKFFEYDTKVLKNVNEIIDTDIIIHFRIIPIV